MKELSKVAMEVVASPTIAVDTLAKQMKADGKDVISFGTGEPDFDTPDNIKEAGIRATQEGKTKYSPATGLLPLRKAISARLLEDCGLSYEPGQIVVTSGAKHCIYLAFQAVINPGDEVVLPAPYWCSYYELIKMAGGVPVCVYGGPGQDFKITSQDLRGAITEKTKLFVINNPSNPTGMLYSKAELQALCDICVQHDLYILTDEIYYHLVYEGEFVSVAALGEEIKARTILINGVSKSYAMTGWRIGYAAAAHPQIIKIMSNYVSNSTGGPNTMAQWAAIEALAGDQSSVYKMKAAFQERRDYICKRAEAIEGVSCLVPQGAFYIMLNIEAFIGKTLGGKHIQNADDFALAFLETAQVAAVSCVGFGAPNFIRMTYATSMEHITRGMDRLESFVNNAP